MTEQLARQRARGSPAPRLQPAGVLPVTERVLRAKNTKREQSTMVQILQGRIFQEAASGRQLPQPVWLAGEASNALQPSSWGAAVAPMAANLGSRPWHGTCDTGFVGGWNHRARVAPTKIWQNWGAGLKPLHGTMSRKAMRVGSQWNPWGRGNSNPWAKGLQIQVLKTGSPVLC